jgi:hypothetical protein
MITFSIFSGNNRQTSLGSTSTNKFDVKDGVLSFFGQLKAPSRSGSYVVDARVIGIDPAVPNPGPAPAPAADGSPAEAGARVEFQSPSLKIKVIE